ncbi:Xaa-His dipeptidase [Clostridium gasigenes]|uniref:Xaa-His dipeptidase n=1 Tax=Clostridium gasigenes TaxID=94869 RepID=UPI001626237B|nr:Xaa-His dipeptidase [Clostridium gasigenes]MBB6622557.1 Xaa-His dipeptidase [Clostridium gasigenes]
MKSIEEIIKENLRSIESMVAEGSTDKEIAEKIGISYSTFKRYKAQNSELKAIIAQGKDKKNQTVEQSLFKCCIGYHYYEDFATKVKKEVLAEDGATVLVEEDIKISKIKKYKAIDLAALKYWLNNKDKTKWKEDPHKVANDKANTKLKEKEVNAKIIEI